jgi:tetratricopeptide (TPR) repeat protein
MGKSRLNAAIVQLAVERGFAGYAGAGQSYGANISYLAWHTIWRDFFQLTASGPPEAQAHRLEAQLAAIDPRLALRAPLLGVALNIPIPDNELTRSLDAQLRTELLRSLLLECLRAAPGGPGEVKPLVLVLEDCHWLDPLSRELLEFIGRNLADLPILLIALYRPSEQAPGPLDWAVRFGHFTEIRLTELEPAQAEQLMRLKLARLTGAAGDVPAGLIEQIMERAQGNPFYIEEMINYIHDRGVDLRDERALQTLDLPDSLHSLIMSRIDRLAENEQITLKVASIVGRQFRAGWLWGSYPELGVPSEVRRYLDRLSRLDLTPLDRPEPELEYLFRHITTQEVAYESLTFALRATLHERVGQFIERSYTATLSQYLDVLAYHYGASRNTDKQRLYFRQAGEATQAAYANTAALDYYQRLLPLLPESEQSVIRRKAGEVLQLIGKWPEAEEMYRQALALAEAAGDRLEQAHCQTELGNLLSYTQSYEEALRWLERARAEFEQLDDYAGMIRVLEYLSLIYVQQSDYAMALERAERQLQLAEARQDKIGISTAVGNVGLVHWSQADYARASIALQQALDSATEAGYQRGMIIAGSNLAGMYAEQGDYAHALVSLRQALDVANDIGYRHAAGVMVGNAGEIYRQQGDYERALACYQHGLQVVTELSDWTIIHNSMLNIAITYAAQGNYRQAEQLFTRTIALGRALNIPYFLCEGLHYTGQLYARQRHYAEAQPINQEALEIAGQVGRKEIQFQAQLLAVRLRVDLRQADVGAAIGELAALRASWSGDAEQAAIDYTIWLLDARRDGSRRAAADRYRALYTRTPNIEYRWRYTQLAGAPLPDPPELPPMAGIVTPDAARLAELLARAERLIETAPWEQQAE